MNELFKNPFFTLDRNIERLLNQSKENRYPHHDIYIKGQGDTAFIEFALAGFKAEDVLIEYNEKNGYITIRSNTQEKTENEDYTYYQRNISRRTFEKSFKLGDYVPGDAVFENGILKIELNKTKDSIKIIPVENKDSTDII